MRHIGDELLYLASENYNFSDRKGKEQFHKHQQEVFLKLKLKQEQNCKILNFFNDSIFSTVNSC